MKKYPASFAAYVEDQYPFLVEILEKPNPPGREDAMRALLQRELEALGATVKVDAPGNLIAYIGEEAEGREVVLLGGHMDSVQPCEGITVQRNGDRVQSAGTTILSADDGAGLFEILVAIRYLRDHSALHLPIDVLFTVGEEVGGIGVRELDIKDLRATYGILMDRADVPGSFVIAGPYKRNFKVTFHGKAAHAFEAEKGVSAIHMAAACVAQFPQGKIHENLYANIGKIQGGESVNQVAESAVLEGEVRAFNKLDAEKLLEEYQRIIDSIQYKFSIAGGHAPTARLDYTARREGYKHETEGLLIKRICELHEKLGIETNMQITRACSDAGELTNKGIATINYGNGAHAVHTKEEWIDMKDIITASWFLVNFLSVP